MTPQEFYEQRDDRTLRCTATPAYQTKSCVMVVDRAMAATHAGQVMAIAVADLMARWCRTVHLDVAEVPLVPELRWMGDSFRRTIEHRMRAVDPFGVFTFNGEAAADFRLVLGARECGAAPGQTVVDASGWVAMVGRTSLCVGTDAPGHPAAALCAATLGVAQVFRDAIGRHSPFGEGMLLDVFTLAAVKSLEVGSTVAYPVPQDVGKILCVGAGAVASSALYSLAMLGLPVDVSCVDRDVLKVLNLSRSPTAVLADVGKMKVEALARALTGSSVRVEPHTMWWREYAATMNDPQGQFDVWLPLANEHGVRPDMQAAAPPLMVQGSTSANWSASFGRHIPRRDDCLVERFPAQPLATLACATATIEVAPEIRVDAALPFLSLMAGALIAFDFVRMTMPGYPQVANLAVFDFEASQLKPDVLGRRPTPDCPYCRNSVAPLVRRDTRYAYLMHDAVLAGCES